MFNFSKEEEFFDSYCNGTFCDECAKEFNMPKNYCCLKVCGENDFCKGCSHGLYEKTPKTEKGKKLIKEYIKWLDANGLRHDKEDKEMSKTKVLSVFPACGKTYMFDHQDEFGLKILDSDSSKFSWIKRKYTEEEIEQEWQSFLELQAVYPSITSQIRFMAPEILEKQKMEYKRTLRSKEKKERNPDFPANYIAHIKEAMEKNEYDYIFVSSHKEVRDALIKAGIKFILVIPDETLLDEYIGRCYRRELTGTNGFPIQLLIDKWQEWLDEIHDDNALKDTTTFIVLCSGEHLSDAIRDKEV